MKNILVLGDFIQDTIINRQVKPVAGYRAAMPYSVHQTLPGGAWHLASILKDMCTNLPAVVAEPRYDELLKSPGKLIRSFEVWAAGKEDKKTVWRNESFLGCEKPEPGTFTVTELLGAVGEIPQADVVVVDDLGLGFVESEGNFIEVLPLLEHAASIVLKTHSHNYNSVFWQSLKQNMLLHKTTVVTTADALRQGGAYVTAGLSWDSTIEEITQELEQGYYATVFSGCRRVVILFDKFGLASFSTGSQEKYFPGSDISTDKLSFERFVYDTQNYEGGWAKKIKGQSFGSLSIAAATTVLLDLEYRYSFAFIAKIALSAIQMNFLNGGEEGSKPTFSKLSSYLKDVFAYFPPQGYSTEEADRNPAEQKNPDEAKKKALKNTLSRFFTAYPCYKNGMEYGISKTNEGWHSDLLSNSAGSEKQALISKAVSVVMNGYNTVLNSVPMANYGKYQTFDREEIERINSVSNLIRTYIDTKSDSRPLSFAVFGAPGSGKSFAIKQLLQTIFGEKNKPITFNMTEMRGSDDLLNAFHIVQDKTVKGDLPLIFWDEFDTKENIWLKEFLAPMQDGEFSEGSITHPLGRAIFVFAGGTCSSYGQYEGAVSGEKAKKGPDFISRLRGYVNIKGPNPPEDEPQTDNMFVIRRAMLFRTMLEIHHKHIFSSDGIPSISPGVVNAFLQVKKYKHGARSLESIITLSTTQGSNHFGASSFPSKSSLNIHVTDDFVNLVNEGELEQEFVNELAEASHNYWMAEKKKQGYIYAPVRCDVEGKKTHPQLIPYSALSESWKESNRITARLTKTKLAKIGYALIPQYEAKQDDLNVEKVIEEHKTELLKLEHDIWLRAKLIEGYEFCTVTSDDLLLHKDNTAFDRLNGSDEVKLDEAMLEAAVSILKRHGYKLRKI